MSGWLLGFGIIYLICLIVGVFLLHQGEIVEESDKSFTRILLLTPVNLLFFTTFIFYNFYEIIKERRKEIKNKKLYSKHKGIDPYGEEDWTIE